ncbi:hypothetical protein D3C72_1946180 [compost metagenome]
MMGTPNASLIHCAVGSSSGSPASHRALRVWTLYFLSQLASCFLSTRTAVGAENMWVTLYFSTMLHHTPASGRVGRPSYMMVVMPAINGP